MSEVQAPIRVGRPLEKYVARVISLVFAACLLYMLVAWRDIIGWYLWILLPLSVRSFFRGIEFPKARRWWLSVAVYAGLCAWCLKITLEMRPLDAEMTMMMGVLLSCCLGKVGLLLSGRIRGVWAFCRRDAGPADGREVRPLSSPRPSRS